MCKILAIDDNSASLEYYNEVSKKLNHDLTFAIHGKQALEILNANYDIHYDVILLDMEMPIMNGLETLKRIRKKNKHIPIIMITAYVDQSKIKKAFKLGATDIFIKPLTMNRLENIINKYNINNRHILTVG